MSEPGGEGGVVAAAVLHVQQQRDVQHVRLQRGIALVRAQHAQQILRRRKRRVGAVDVHALPVDIIVVGMVAVDGQHRQHADQLEALLKLGLQAAVADGIVIAGQRQHAAGQRVHQVLAGSLHDDIAGEVGGQIAAGGQRAAEGGQLLLGGQIAQQQQIGRLLKGKALAAQPADEVIDIIAAVPQPARAGHLLAVAPGEGVDAGDAGQPHQHALAVLVAQAALDVVALELLGADLVVAHALLGEQASFLLDSGIFGHGVLLPGVKSRPGRVGDPSRSRRFVLLLAGSTNRSLAN